MIRRILTASVLSVGMAISGLSVAAQAATAPSATATVSGVTQTMQTATTAQTAAPSIDCGAGIVATVCAIVLGPICRNRCEAAGSAQTQAATATSGATNTARSVSAPAAAGTTTAASPKLFCEPTFQLVCDVIALLFCRQTGCPAPPEMATAAEQPRSVQTCTVDLRPNVYCLLQQV